MDGREGLRESGGSSQWAERDVLGDAFSRRLAMQGQGAERRQGWRLGFKSCYSLDCVGARRASWDHPEWVSRMNKWLRAEEIADLYCTVILHTLLQQKSMT